MGLFPTTAEQVTVTMPLTSVTPPFEAEGVNVFFGYQRRHYLPVVLRNYIAPSPDLTVSTKTVDRAWANAGEVLHYTIELRNTGTRAAAMHFSDPIPAGTTLSGTVEGGTYRSGQVEWSGRLDVDATHRVAFDVRLDEGVSGEIINTATIDDGYHKAPFQQSASTQVVIANPGFETGDLTGWQHGAELAQSVSVNEPHTGAASALLGDPNYDCDGGVLVGRAWMEQRFAVPSEGTPALSFWYRIHTYAHLTWTDKTLGDSFDVSINGTLILQDNYENYPGDVPGCDDEQDLGWEQSSYDLSGYRGQTITLLFENVSREDRWYNTWTYVDEVLVSP